MSRMKIESDALSVLCDPDTRYPLELDAYHLRNTATGRVFPIRDGIPLFVSTLTGRNLKSQIVYDRFAASFDLAERLRTWLTRAPDFRPEFVSELEITPGARVLEVSVGTGANLRYLPANISFYGVDLSWNMLRKCQRNLKRWQRKGYLFQGEAERLPFRGEVFDCVYHVYGINSFTDKARAIKEMIWVARPGTKIVIVDEIVRASRDDLKRNPSASQHPEPGREAAGCPIDLVPKEMKEIKARELDDGKLYCLTFRKP
jgi:SAM-dependent methyltransferase